MIAIDGLSVSYGGTSALDAVTLSVAPGEFVLLSGPSGCGKSTLVRCLNGLIPHVFPAQVSGRVSVAGMDPIVAGPALMAEQVGVVFQNPAAQLFNLTVRDELAFGPHNLGLPPDVVAQRVLWAAEAVGVVDLLDRSPHTLSGGEQQRVAIAAVLAMGPRLLVLDEPAANLDVPGSRLVAEVLDRLNRERGVTVLVVEHRLRELARLATRTVLMTDGHIVADGPTERVLANRKLLRDLGMRRPTDLPLSDWPSLITDPSVAPRPDARLLSLHGVWAGYERQAVLRDLSMDLHQGEFVAVVGHNGAGKTTLGRVLAGLLRPMRGVMDGQIYSNGRARGMLFQNPAEQLFCDTVDEEVALGPRNFGGFDCAQHHRLLEIADLLGLRERSVHALSRGQQQRTTLAAVLALQPQLLILDEPTIGQDWAHLSRLMDLVRKLNQAGHTVVLMTHDYKLIHQYAQRVLILDNGRIVAEGAPPRQASKKTR